MGRLAPGTATNIHPSSALGKYVYAQSVPASEAIPMGGMTLAAACASGPHTYYPARDHAECGCGRCGR